MVVSIALSPKADRARMIETIGSLSVSDDRLVAPSFPGENEPEAERWLMLFGPGEARLSKNDAERAASQVATLPGIAGAHADYLTGEAVRNWLAASVART